MDTLKKYWLYLLIGLALVLVFVRVLDASVLVSLRNKLFDLFLESERNKVKVEENNKKIEEGAEELQHKQAEVNQATLDDIAKKLNDRYKK